MGYHELRYIFPPLISLAVGIFLALLSVLKGRFKTENVLFSLTCLLVNLTCLVFVSHHLVDDLDLILEIDRWVHTVYVFVVPVSLQFFFLVLGIRNRPLVALAAVFSVVVSSLTHTDLYFTGQRTFTWGHIAVPGPAFTLLGTVSFVEFLSISIIFLMRFRKEKRPAVRLKLGYIMISMMMICAMLTSNLPAIYGYPFYPLGNFMFIPMGILGYGMLRYRLLDVRGFVHVTFFWTVVSLLMILPNAALFFALQPYLKTLPAPLFIASIMLWFLLNNIYYSRIQPAVDQLFNRRKYNLIREEGRFIDYLYTLKSPAELITGMTTLMKNTLGVSNIGFCMRGDDEGPFIGCNGGTLVIGPALERAILESEGLMAVDEGIWPPLEGGPEYVLPIALNGTLMALITLTPDPRRGGLLSDAEMSFVNSVRRAVAIALSNSLMYKRITDMTENLEKIVMERTSTIESQKSVLEREIALASRIQQVMLPNNIPDIPNVSIAYRWEPMMGVSGDFLDVHYRRDYGEVGLFICDVSGHGVSAALLASMVKMSLNSWGRFIRKPSEGLAQIHKLLVDKLGDNFVTACLCCYDPVAKTMTFANAGHPPVVIIREGDLLVESVQGKFICAIVRPVFEEKTIPLVPGDRVVLFTDGVTDVQNPEGEMLGFDAFYDLLLRNGELSPQELCDVVYDEIVAFSGGQAMDDDITILVMGISA